MIEKIIRIQQQKFDQNSIYNWLSADKTSGAITMFIGKVRDVSLKKEVHSLYLEHYPKMIEKVLAEIAAEAEHRWHLQRIAIVHRIGHLHAGEEIVLVGISAMHRNNAYHANEFIMDFLKNKAPFWKKEFTPQGESWVAHRNSDELALEKWHKLY